MFKIFAKAVSAAKGVAAGKLQQNMGMQSPKLPTSVTRIGRFGFISTAGFIVLCYYTGYVNSHTNPGDGPKLLIPGLGGKGSGSVSRPDPTSVGKSGSIAGTGTIGGAPGSVGSIPGVIGGVVSGIDNIAGGAGVVSGNPKAAYPSLVERTDQGVDFGGAPGNNSVRALADGVITQVGAWHGWPSNTGDGMVYKARGVPHPIFIQESFKRAINPATGKAWQPGDQVRQGQLLGTVIFPGTGIETGYTNSAQNGPLTPYGSSPDGTPTPGGLAFRRLLGYK